MIVKCLECGKEIIKIPSIIKRGGGKYCSLKCKGAAQSKIQKINPTYFNSISVVCKMCGKQFNSPIAWIKRGRSKFCSKKCCGEWRSANMVKDMACNWRGGINPLFAKIRGTKEYSEWRAGVFKRDGFKCQKCGESKSGSFHAHHKILFSEIIYSKPEAIFGNDIDLNKVSGLLWDINNGVTLCKICHKKEHRRNK